MIFESAVFSDERYILDDRQLYLLREAPRQMTIYALGDLRDLWKHEDYLADHFDFTGIYEPDPVDEKFDIIADRTAKMLRSIIKELVDKHTKNPWDRMHEFDVDYDGLIVTDVEYQSLLALPDSWLMTFLRHVVNLSNTYLDGLLEIGDAGIPVDMAFDPRSGDRSGYEFRRHDYHGETKKLNDINNWKKFIKNQNLTTDDLKRCDDVFWGSYHRYHPVRL